MDLTLTSWHSLFVVTENSITSYIESVEKYKLIDRMTASPFKTFSDQNAIAAIMNLWILISHNPKTLVMDPYKIMAYPQETLYIQSLQRNREFQKFHQQTTEEQQLFLAFHLFLQLDKWLDASNNKVIHGIISQYKSKDYFLIWTNPAWEDDINFLKDQKVMVYTLTSIMSHDRSYELMVKKAIHQTRGSLKRLKAFENSEILHSK